MLDIPVNVQELGSSAFLSDLVQKQPVNVDIDMDLGMPLDMTLAQGIFDRGDESGVYGYGQADLDPKDRALLKDPEGGETASRSQPGVAFLRRTEYISSEAIKQQGADSSRLAALKRQAGARTDPESQLKAVEATFDATAADISQLRHPKKKGVHAVESYPLLPDSKMFDLVYVSVKMVGSASLHNQKRPFSDDSLATSLFRQAGTESDEWMQFYVAADDQTATALREKADSTADTLPVDDNVYKFTRVQDNDVDLRLHTKDANDEIAISVSDVDGVKQALYVPILGRASLKRRRVVRHRKEQADEMSVDVVELSLREINPDESIARDDARSGVDPVNYTKAPTPEPESVDVDDDEDNDNDAASPAAADEDED